MPRVSKFSIVPEIDVKESEELLNLPSLDQKNLRFFVNIEGVDDIKTIEFLAKYKLIGNESSCKCGSTMSLVQQNRKNEGMIWRCSRCKKNGETSTFSLRSNTLFASSKISMSKTIALLEIWANNSKLTQSEAAAKTGVSRKTVGQFYELFRDITEIWMKKRCRDQMLGGPGKIVEDDESAFFKAKHNRGRMVRSTPQWVFGLVERGTSHMVLKKVARRDADTLLEIIRKTVKPAPADVCQVLISLIAFRFPIAGWEGCLLFPHLEKLGFVLSQYTVLLELCALLMLSANRLSAIAMPISHNKIWSTKSTYILFVLSAVISLIPTSVRLPQESAYINITGSYVPYLVNEEDQAQNSLISCVIYITFCIASLVCNIVAICIHSKQRKMQLFDSQPKLAAKVQTNLLIYSCIFTTLVIAMTTFQCLLAIDAFPLRSEAHNLVIVFLTISADALALSNPWLLFCLSSTFRHKFLEARRIPKIFSTSSTNETS